MIALFFSLVSDMRHLKVISIWECLLYHGYITSKITETSREDYVIPSTAYTILFILMCLYFTDSAPCFVHIMFKHLEAKSKVQQQAQMVCKNMAELPDGKCQEKHLESRYQILHSDVTAAHGQCISRIFAIKMEYCKKI